MAFSCTYALPCHGTLELVQSVAAALHGITAPAFYSSNLWWLRYMISLPQLSIHRGNHVDVPVCGIHATSIRSPAHAFIYMAYEG